MAENEHIETQQQILKAAMKHFAEYGYHGASIAKIAEEAKVSKSLIFWYFESKSVLFQFLIDNFIQACKSSLSTTGPAGDARAKIEKLIDIYWEFIGENLWFVRIFINWFMQLDSQEKNKDAEESQKKILAVREIHKEFRQIFTDYLIEGKEQGIFRQDLDVTSAAILFVSSLEGILLQFLVDQMDAKEMGKNFFQSVKKNLIEGLLKKD
jgi:TetR/AcrR family transcriptional regulator